VLLVELVLVAADEALIERSPFEAFDLLDDGLRRVSMRAGATA